MVNLDIHQVAQVYPDTIQDMILEPQPVLTKTIDKDTHSIHQDLHRTFHKDILDRLVCLDIIPPVK